MQIPYETSARPDTGLYNAKLGIWLFLASEVMLFGGLFSGYLFLRLGAEDGYWPHGLLNVPVGAFNTVVLIASSVTIVLTWANLKMRRWAMAQRFLLFTILCGVLFLGVKLLYEYPQKFQHFGAFIRQDAAHEYEAYLGNDYLKEKGLAPRFEISGHLHEVEIHAEDADRAELDQLVAKRHLEIVKTEDEGKLLTVKVNSPADAEALAKAPGKVTNPEETDPAKQARKIPGVRIEAYELALDPVNANPTDPASDRPHFLYRHATEKMATLHAKDVEWASSFAPKHSTYFSIYFTITGLHGAHVLAGVLVMTYFYFFGQQIYLKNPEHQANRIEVVGLFWHFVDLVWIFVFPIFYLL